MSEFSETFVLPEGRLINGHFFVRSVYTDDKGREGQPQYKGEVAYEKGVLDEDGGFKDYLWDIMSQEWGEEYVSAKEEAGLLRWPIKDGDSLAEKREERGKPGDAYKGMEVVRAATNFNKHGDPDDGGIDVFDEAVNEVKPANKMAVYNGCLGHMAVRAKARRAEDNISGKDYITCTLYLEAFQKTGDGEKLSAAPSRNALFKPKTAAKTGGRRK